MVGVFFPFQEEKNEINFLLEDVRFPSFDKKINHIINVKCTKNECGWPQNVKEVKRAYSSFS